MTRSRHLAVLTTAAVVATVAMAVPAAADSWFSVAIGGDDFAVGFGAGDWAPYGSAWSDPGWSVDYRVALGSYGEWVWVDGLGSVWRPWVAADWRPYSHGRWVWTSYGWTWVAYEPWGWLPHHYGSWALAPAGWVWVPGHEYRPANVVWVTSGHYVGWYPCAPNGWSHHHRGFHHGYRHGYHDGRHDGYRDGYRDGWDDALEATWVDRRHVGADDLSRHAVEGGRLSRSAMVSKPAVLEGAPGRGELDRHAERRIPEARVSTRTVELGGREVLAVRAEGVERDVASHSLTTARTALSPAVVERVERQAAAVRTTRPVSDADGGKPVARESKPAAPQRRTTPSVAPAAGPRAPERSRQSSGVAAGEADVRTRSTVSRPVAPAAPAASRSADVPSRRAPAVPSSTRVEAEQRPRTVPAPVVQGSPRVDRRSAPAAGTSERGRGATSPAEAGPASPRKPTEVKPDDRRPQRTARHKPATPKVPQTKEAGSTTKGNR